MTRGDRRERPGARRITPTATALALVLADLPARADPGAPDGPAVAFAGVVDPDLPRELMLPSGSARIEARRLEAAGLLGDAAWLLVEQPDARHDPAFTYHAARLHAAAGHHAAALRLLARCADALAADHGASATDAAQAIAAAHARSRAATLAVHLRLVELTADGVAPVPPDRLRGAIILSQKTLSNDHVPENLFVVGDVPPPELRLDPGEWTAQVELPGFLPVTVERSIAGDGDAWDILVQRRVHAVELRFEPREALLDARLRLVATDHASPLAIDRPLAGPTAAVALTAGPWRLEVEAAHHRAEIDLSIGTGETAIAVELRERPASRAARAARFERNGPLMFGLFGALAASYFGGAGMALAGSRLKAHAWRRDRFAHDAAELEDDRVAAATIEATYPKAEFRRDLAVASGVRDVGLVLAGMSVGAAAAVMPVAMRARHRVAYVELAVGVPLLAAGAAWMGWAQQQRAHVLAGVERADLHRLRTTDQHGIAAALLTGAGLGLTLFSGVALTNDFDRRHRRARGYSLAPLASPTLAGLSLRGRF